MSTSTNYGPARVEYIGDSMQSSVSGRADGGTSGPFPPVARGRHTGPDDGACLMELASMLAGEPFSDSPQSVHPVLASVARAVNDRVGDGTRSRLARLVPMMLHTDDTGLQGCAAVVVACADAALATEHCDMATRCGLEAARRRARRVLAGRALSAHLRTHRSAAPLAGLLDWAYCHGAVLRTAEAVAVVANADPGASQDEDEKLESLLVACASAASEIAGTPTCPPTAPLTELLPPAGTGAEPGAPGGVSRAAEREDATLVGV